MSELLDKWLVHYDPIHRGWTPSGIANAVCTTSGIFFPRVRGGWNLYRGQDSAAAIDYSQVVGAAGAEATEVRNFAWRGHEAARTYFYALRAVGPGGVESETGENVRRFETDGNGNWLGPQPNQPQNVSVRRLAGGVFKVRWTYSPVGQETAPVSFRLYNGENGSPINYSEAVATVAYRPGRHYYGYESVAFADGVEVDWAVRAVSAEGREDSNVLAAAARADASGPARTSAVLSRAGAEAAEPGEP